VDQSAVLWILICVDLKDENYFVRCSFFWDVQTPTTVCSAPHQLLAVRLSVLITVAYVIAPGFM